MVPICWKKLGLISLFLLLFLVGKGQDTPQRELSFQQEQVTLQTIFEKLEQNDFVISYNNQNIDNQQHIKLNSKNIKVVDLLTFLEQNYQITAKLERQKIIFRQKTQYFTLSGFVKDFASKESLPSANIFSKNLGTSTNTYGFFSLQLPKGLHELEFSFIGYETKKTQIFLEEDTSTEILLKEQTFLLDDVVVLPQRNTTTIHDFATINLGSTQKKGQVFGNDDILKRTQFLSGISGGQTGFSELNVRGGNSNENLVLLDGVPIYNYNHFPGLLSVFNTDALKKAHLYKGLFPARFAGKLSSVLDIGMREGDMQNFHWGGSFDFAIFSLFAEGPIKKEQSSFMLSMRRSWFDLFSKLLNKDDTLIDFHLFDINAKANYILNKTNRFYLSLYKGNDRFGSSDANIDALAWGNKVASLRWNHIFSDQIFLNTTAYYSNFDNTLYSETPPSFEERKTTYSLKEKAVRTDFEYFGNKYHLKFGGKLTENKFSLPQMSFETTQREKERTFQFSTYIENNFTFTDKWKANIGLNYVAYKHKISQNFFQPRLILKYNFHPLHQISAGFSEMQQYIHHLSNSSISIPYSFRLPSSEKLPAGTSKLYELNYDGFFRDQKDKLHFSLYYKMQQNIPRYKQHQKIALGQLAPNWEEQIMQGKRKGIGIESSYYANFKPFEVEFSYSFSDMKEQFTQLNQGKYFPSTTNVKHYFKTNITYCFGKTHSQNITMSAYYSSGQHLTIPSYYTTFPNHKQTPISITDKINNYKLRDNFQIDVAYTLDKKIDSNKKQIFKVGILAIIGKPAPFYAYPFRDENMLKINATRLPSPLPYISYSFKF